MGTALRHSLRTAGLVTAGSLAACALLLLGACGQIVGIEGDRYVAAAIDRDASSSDANVNVNTAAWGCLKDPTPPPSTATTVKATFTFIDPTNQVPVQGFTVRACTRVDVGCTSPVSPTGTTDATGTVVVTVPTGFNGFYEVQGRDDYYPIMFVRPPIFADATIRKSYLSKKLTDGFIASSGTAVNPNDGNLSFFVNDCGGKGGAGVSFVVQNTGGELSPLLYLANSLPVAGGTATDGSGIATIINASPGAVSAKALLADGTTSVGERGGIVRPGWFTYFDFAAQHENGR